MPEGGELEGLDHAREVEKRGVASANFGVARQLLSIFSIPLSITAPGAPGSKEHRRQLRHRKEFRLQRPSSGCMPRT